MAAELKWTTTRTRMESGPYVAVRDAGAGWMLSVDGVALGTFSDPNAAKAAAASHAKPAEAMEDDPKPTKRRKAKD